MLVFISSFLWHYPLLTASDQLTCSIHYPTQPVNLLTCCSQLKLLACHLGICHKIYLATKCKAFLSLCNSELCMLCVHLSPIYTMNIAAACDATSFATGETPVTRCRKRRELSQWLIAKVEPSSTFATACISTWDAPCIAAWETQVASWALAYHVCFPLVALDSRQNSINWPSLSHVATTCVSHVAAIFLWYKSGFKRWLQLDTARCKPEYLIRASSSRSCTAQTCPSLLPSVMFN